MVTLLKLKKTVLVLLLLCCFLLAGCGIGGAAASTISFEVNPSPTPAESAAMPTPSPAPSPTPRPAPPAGDDFYDSFFDSSVIIGDSITQGLQNYVMRARLTDPALLGGAKFAAVKSFSLKKAASNSTVGISLQYRGKKYNIPGVITAMAAKKVFIMLGVNDWAGSQIDNCIKQYSEIIDHIREVHPDVQIYIESCTPIAKAKERKNLNNTNLDKFNEALKKLCMEKKVSYVDISTALKDEKNALKPAFSSDGYVHMSAQGAKAWVDALYQFACNEYNAGRWSPENLK